MKPLFTSYLHRKRIEVIKPYLNRDVLDIGCGSATIAQQCFRRSQHYVGIDIDKGLIEELRERYPNYDFYCCNIDKSMPALNRKFDMIAMIAVIEHLTNPENVLHNCYTLLKNDENLIITTPTPFGGEVHKIGAITGLTSKEAADDHHKFYSHKNMSELLKENGFYIKLHQKFEFGLNQIFVCKRNLVKPGSVNIV